MGSSGFGGDIGGKVHQMLCGRMSRKGYQMSEEEVLGRAIKCHVKGWVEGKAMNRQVLNRVEAHELPYAKV